MVSSPYIRFLSPELEEQWNSGKRKRGAFILAQASLNPHSADGPLTQDLADAIYMGLAAAWQLKESLIINSSH